HPDVYERAVLRKPQQKAFGVTVDLWSIGVTFYHAATGCLPFVPFGGPRRNKEIMYKITTEKPRGAIAGVQRQENGSIEWSYELPITCRLSAGLKDQLIPILANILEVDQEKCWGFDQFFAGTNDILHRIVVDVFSLQQASSHRVYIHSYNTTTKFLDAVFKQTNIVPHHQEYFFEGHLYELDPNLQAHNFCRTTESSPLTLLSTSEQPEDVVGVRYRDPALEFPKFTPKVDVVADCSSAKSALGAAYQTLRLGRALRSGRELLARGLHWKSLCSPRSPARGGFLPLDRFSCRKIHFLSSLRYEAAPAGSRGPAGVEVVETRLQRVDEELSQCSHSIFDFQGALDGILAELVKDRQQVHEDKRFVVEALCLLAGPVLVEQFPCQAQPLVPPHTRRARREQLNLGNLAKKVVSIFQNECVQQYQEALALHSSRMRKVCEIKKHLKRLSNRISACSVEMMECQDCMQ
ncbi:IKKE kinase, partial [Spelaeornis formosus]|nr:IKKE kinase [Elachura formosa]